MVAGAAASCGVLNIQNQESAENDRVAPLMICVRSSFDSGAACVRLADTKSFGRIPARRTQAAPLSKRCPDTKLEPRNHFRKF